MSYGLADFDRVFEAGFAYQLHADVRGTIEALSKEVGAPDYICTPLFEKKRRIEFKAPVAKPSNTIDDIRKNMNKISDRTFDSLVERIINDIRSVELETVDEMLFAIASGNAFYSKLYARLYKMLCDTFSELHPPTSAEFVFDSPIEQCDPNKDYDRYCDIMKANERRRALALFCVNLMNEGAIDSDVVFGLLDDLHSRFGASIQAAATKAITDELSELLYLVMVNSNERLKTDERWPHYIEHVKEVTKRRQTLENGLTSKSIFKHMDIVDALC